jgi:hypothetical protein
MIADYQLTALWATAFCKVGLQDNQKTARDDLLSALRKLEARVAPLLAKIDASCHELTIHDISHVHQLWSVASEICGPDYPLNPLEGFVLGAAFLIHDAGLTAAAYPQGLTGLRQTNYYRDRVAALMRSVGNGAPDEKMLESPSDEIAQRALFDTLRAIHAKRAETLLDEVKPHPLTGQPYPLFSDLDLFLDCGETIGLVAASHHWNIDDVDERFQDPLTAPANFPGWPIDAVKLACILRAADACAVDERRARIMPFILLNPSGVSRDHWIFQAYLKPAERRDEALVFQSKFPFSREHMSAWWVAYDAIRIADRELRNCDQLLRDRAISGRHPTLKPFLARRIEGAGEPGHLKNAVQVSGWTPVDTAVRIDNPISLVEKLGGWHLYGADFSAPFRELLQNAADAVRARRRRQNGYEGTSEYPGRIDITFDSDSKDEELSNFKMIVADDGVGMSSNVMTGALLDFGRSFWDTSEAAENYPGLLSDPLFQPTGKFGIGFYSIFMIADDVKVISRPWQAGPKDAKVLHFQNGARGRAEFRDFHQDEDGYYAPKYSTIIIAKVKYPRWLGHFASLSHGSPSINQLWKNLVRASKELVFALNVECWLSNGGLDSEKLNEPGVLELPASEFARRFNDTFYSPTDSSPKGFEPEEIPLIDKIRDKQGRVHTQGCIGSHGMIGLWHIGGFTCFGIGNGLIKGVRGGKPLTASRLALSDLASKNELRSWGDEQLRRLDNPDIDPMFKIAAISTLSSIDVDIRQSAMVIADGKPQTVKNIVTKLGPNSRIFVMVQRVPPAFSNAVFELKPNSPFFGFSVDDLKDLKHDLRIWGVAVRTRESYCQILGSLDAPTNQNSAYGALHQALKDAGFRIKTEPPDNYTVGIYNGPKGGRGYLQSRQLVRGSEVKSYGFVMHVKRE